VHFSDGPRYANYVNVIYYQAPPGSSPLCAGSHRAQHGGKHMPRRAHPVGIMKPQFGRLAMRKPRCTMTGGSISLLKQCCFSHARKSQPRNSAIALGQPCLPDKRFQVRQQMSCHGARVHDKMCVNKCRDLAAEGADVGSARTYSRHSISKPC